MALAQDQTQANQAQSILDEQKYQRDLAQYEKDLIQWEKEKAAIEAENKKIIATETKKRADAKIAEDKRVADFNAAEDKRISDFNVSEDKRISELKSKDAKLVADAISFVKADQKVKADIALKAETKRLADLAIKEEKQRAKQEVIDKNKAFFDSGKRFYGGKEIHHAKLQGVPTQEGEIKYYDGGKFTDSYYERAGKQMGITTEQARKVSQAGRISQSGKARDQVLRSFQDPTGASEALYQENRRLAAKVTASAYGAIAVKKAQELNKLSTVSGGVIGKAAGTDIHSSSSLVGTNVKAPQGSYAEQIETARRTQRTIDLRAGNVGLATALLEPVTTQEYTNTSGNTSALSLTKTFLTERGYDLNNLDAVPDSVFEPTKYTTARKQATKSEKTNTPMGDLTKLIPAQPTMYEKKKVGTAQVGATLNEYYKTVPNADLVKRTEARERLESIGKPVISVQPMQGPVQPDSTPQTKWQVSSGLTKTVTIPTMGGGTYSAQVPTNPMVFDTKEQAQAYIDYQNKTNPYTISEGYSKQGDVSPQKQFYSDAYKFLDDTGKTLQKQEGVAGDIYRGLSWQGGNPIGVAKMGVGAIIQIDNLATQNIAPYVSGSLKPTPLVQSSESSDQIVFPYDFEKGRFKTGEEVASASLDYMKTYGTGDFTGGVVGGYWIGPKGVKQLLRPMGVGGQTITMQTAAKTIAGAPVQEAVPVAKEFKLFGKTVATKTYNNPTTISSVEKLKLADTSGSYSWGKTSAAEVLAKADITPQGRGLELMTGVKQQTQFNKAVVQELVKQGKINPSDVKFVENIERGVELARKQKPVMYSGFGEKPLKFIPSGPITQAILRGIGKAQSPINFSRLKTRLGQVGGSMAQDTQLRPKYQKGAKHDFDIDAPKTEDAARHTKTIYDEVSPHSTDDVKIELSGNKKKITVTSKETGGKPDEFVELLDSKDAVKYQSVAQESGLRFGEKYRTDKLSKVLKQPLKESDSGIKVRDIKDQILAKASSVVSLQGRTTEKFKGVTEVGSWEAKQNKLIDDGVLHVDPPALRGKDTVDLYKIFKSRAEELSESTNPIKKAQGRELDEIAESVKSRSPELDFTQKSGDVTSYVVSEKSVSSLASDSLKSYSNTPTLIPTTIPTTSTVLKQPTTPTRSTVSPTPSIFSKTQSISSISKPSISSISKPSISSTSKPSISSTSKPSISSTSKPSISSTSKPSISSTSKSAPSKSALSRLNPNKSTPNPSRPSRASRSSRGNSGNQSPITSRRRAVAGLVNITEGEKKKKTTKDKKTVDFIGNTRLDNVVGLFKRREIISGDKASAKQLRRDKKFKEGGKKRKHKAKKSFGQRIGVIEKGFKI